MKKKPEITEADSEARRRILAERRRNVAIEASAGTGKTQLLTERLLGFLADGGKIDRMIVVTFTRTAAAELRTRIRRSIQEGRLPPERASEQKALLPAAVIDTIHGFCSQILRRFSHIAGIDPGFDVSDSFMSSRSLARRWDEYLSGLEDDLVVRNLSLLCSIGDDFLPSLGILASLPDWFTGRECITAGVDPERLGAGWWLRKIDELEREAAGRTGPDTLGDWVDSAVPALRAALEAPADTSQIEPVFHGSYRVNLGSAGRWPGGGKGRIHGIAGEIRADMAADLLTGQFLEVCMPFVSALRAERDDERSHLSYDDLLWKCRDVFARNPDLRAELLAGIDHVFMDEFQDTSTIQAELFRSLLEDGCGRLPDGVLTIVGDRKQSIFGWRAADLLSYISLNSELERQGALVMPISVNFRSTSSIIRFVNSIGPHIFLRDDGNLPPNECAYAALEPRRGAGAGPPVRVAFFPAELQPHERRLQEADWLARRLVERRREEGDQGWAMIVPARTEIELYLDSLTAHGLPFVLDSGKDFPRRMEIADIASLLSVLAGPHDPGALAAVLRSTLFGITDTEITASLLAGLESFLEPPDAVPDRVRRACDTLTRLRLLALTSPPAEFLDRLYGHSPVAGVIASSGHDVQRRLANLQFLFDLTASDKGMSLAGLADILAKEEGEGELADPQQSPGDPSTITVTTIHKSKGLQYGHVVFLASQGGGSGGRDVAWSERDRIAGVRMPGGRETLAYRRIVDAQKASRTAEGRRLLYVALTRAEKSLTVVTNRSGPAGPIARLFNQAFDAMSAEDPECALVEEIEPSPPRPSRRCVRPPAEREEALPSFTPSSIGLDSGPSVPMLLGSCVHAVMEKIDFGDPAGWLDRHLPSMSLPEDVAMEEVRKLAESFFAIPDLPFAPGRDRITGREFPVVFRETGMPKEQYIDLLVETGGRLVAIDYKTDSVDEEGIGTAIANHEAKQSSYGAHLARSLGKPVAVYIAFLNPRTARLVGSFDPAPTAGGESPPGAAPR